MQGATAYDDPAKDAWRGWKWNSIAAAATRWRRLPPSEMARQLSGKTTLYLVGPDDHDRKRALARGFANHNLIAVDLVQDRVDEVRAAGGLAIRGSLQQLIMNWPHDWPIDVVDADLCSGLVNDVGELPNCFYLSRAMHADTVISINLMRGRDAHSNGIRQCLKNHCEPLFAKMPGSDKCHDIVKHRASNWLMSLAGFTRQVKDIACGVPDMFDEQGRRGVFLSAREVRELYQEVWNPVINSYRSKTSGQVFDSVVHRWGAQVVDQDGIPKKSWTDQREAVTEKLSAKCANTEGVRERIAALRAVRTTKMRQLGLLKPTEAVA